MNLEEIVLGEKSQPWRSDSAPAWLSFNWTQVIRWHLQITWRSSTTSTPGCSPDQGGGNCRGIWASEAPQVVPAYGKVENPGSGVRKSNFNPQVCCLLGKWAWPNELSQERNSPHWALGVGPLAVAAICSHLTDSRGPETSSSLPEVTQQGNVGTRFECRQPAHQKALAYSSLIGPTEILLDVAPHSENIWRPFRDLLFGNKRPAIPGWQRMTERESRLQVRQHHWLNGRKSE